MIEFIRVENAEQILYSVKLFFWLSFIRISCLTGQKQMKLRFRKKQDKQRDRGAEAQCWLCESGAIFG